MHTIPLLREFRKCQLTYYKQGIKKLRDIYPKYPLIICTDSPDWVTPLLSELDSNCYLSPIIQDIEPKFSDFCTLYLADAMVMSNSTYSFWSAYLINHRTIIAPSPWWDPSGFVGTSMGLNSHHLHHPDWWILDTDTGHTIYDPHSIKTQKSDDEDDIPTLFKLIRGFIV